MKNLQALIVGLSLMLPFLSETVGATTAGASEDFPKIMSVITTRDVTSKHSARWDIKHKGSRRLRHIDEEAVQLKVVVHSPEEEAHFMELQRLGVVQSYEDFEAGKEEKDQQRRNMQGINEDLYCYRTVEETHASMELLAAQYPDLVKVQDIGQSYLKSANQGGYDIKIMVIGAPNTNPNLEKKVDMMVVGGHHPRELPPPETIVRWAEHLVTNYGRDPDITWILDRTDIHIVPIANPDGRQIVQDNLEWFYRKNARPNGCNRGETRYGTDLNRNYPMFWGDDNGSSNSACSTDYRGTQPLSEPESYAVYRYANNLFDDSIKKGSSTGEFTGNAQEARELWEQACPTNATGMFIDVHSNGDFVYFPWGYKDKASPNHLPQLTMSAKLAHPGNYELWGPEQDGFLYFVSGDASDSTYGIDCVFSFGYEIGSEMYASCSELKSSIFPIMQDSLLYAAKCVSAPYLLPLGPDVLSIDVNSTDPSRVSLVVLVSDEELIVDHAVYSDKSQRSQPIQEVRVFVDNHPYDASSTGYLMYAQDGAYDSVDEVAVITMDLSQLQGQHTLYFQGTDAHGYAGPVSSVFLDLPTIQIFPGGDVSEFAGNITSNYTVTLESSNETVMTQQPSATQEQPSPGTSSTGSVSVTIERDGGESAPEKLTPEHSRPIVAHEEEEEQEMGATKETAPIIASESGGRPSEDEEALVSMLSSSASLGFSLPRTTAMLMGAVSTALILLASE